MSTYPTASSGPAVGERAKFGDLLADRYRRAGESQRDVAEWLTDWMMRHDLEKELAAVERSCSDEDLDDTKDAIAVIRTYLATNSWSAAEREITQGAVSKWRKGDGKPSPAKWVAVAAYMGLPLGETYRLVVFMELPKSMVALQQQLASARKDNEDLRTENAEVRAELARAERAHREVKEQLTEMRLRLDTLDVHDSNDVGPISVP